MPPEKIKKTKAILFVAVKHYSLRERRFRRLNNKLFRHDNMFEVVI